MSFREKTAWLMLAILGAVTAWYVPVIHRVGGTQPPAMSRMFLVVAAIVVLSVVGNTVLAILSRDEAGEPADERERLIALKSSYWAHNTLVSALLLALGWFMLFGGGPQLFHVVFASLLVAQFVDYAAQVVLLRSRV